MPSRIIHDKCRKSRTLNALSAEAERLFWRLTTAADDYGRFDADPRVLLGECFPYKIEIFKSAQVEKWRDELTVAGDPDEEPLVRLYSLKGRIYGCFVKWTDYQRDRSKEKNPPKPKFPAPEDGVPVDVVTAALIGNAPQPAAEKSPAKAVTPASPSAAEMRFDQFWAVYPDRGGKKVGKQAARILFLKLTDEEQAQIIPATKAYAKYCKDQERTPRDAQRFIKGGDGEPWRDFIPGPSAPVRRPMSAVQAPQPARPPAGEDMPEELVRRFLGKDMSMRGEAY
ncbi:MAG: hypothetical protein HQL97_00330 [Magnetococcales bacterium]|nr:hypothetical protein [Magnetococcales bacterium]